MILLIDANNIVHKAHHGGCGGGCGGGGGTGSIYGFLVTLLRIKKTYQIKENTRLILVWDGGSKRKKTIYPDYKKDRKPNPEIHNSIRKLYNILEALNVEQYQMYGEEADDVIATLTKRARMLGQKVLIFSNDHDFEQLITRHVKIVSEKGRETTVKDLAYNEAKYMGLTREQIVEVMVLCGCSGDNTPSIPGLGDITAMNLIKTNGNIYNILNNDEIFYPDKKGILKKATENLYNKLKDVENQKKIYLNYELIKLKNDLPIDFKLKSNKKNDWEYVIREFETLEFNRFLKNIEDFKTTFGE